MAIASSPLFLRLLLLLAWLLAVAGVALAVNRSRKTSGDTGDEASREAAVGRPEAVRKVVHIGTGNIILLAWWLQIPMWVGVGASGVASTITLLSYWQPLLPVIDSVGRRSFGTVFYSLSIGLLIALFWSLGQPEYAAIGVLVMAWGDGLAALVGQRWGKHPYKILGMTKSWEGSLAMAVASGLVTYGVLSVAGLEAVGLGLRVAVAVAIALLATLLEAVSFLGVDNLTVPLCSAIAAWQLLHWLQGGLS